MSSLTSAGLIYAANKAIIGAAPALKKIAQFGVDFSSEAVPVGTTMKIPFFGYSNAEAFDASSANYEHSSATVTQVAVEFNQHVKATYEFTDKDCVTDNVVAGGFWDKAGIAGGKQVAYKLLQALADKINSTNMTGTPGITLGSTFTKADLAKVYKACYKIGADPADCVIVMSPTYYSQMLSLFDASTYGGASAVQDGVVEGLYGFKSCVCLNPHVTGTGSAATDDFNCAIVPQSALVIAARTVPVNSPSVYEESGTQTDEGTGLTLGIRRHGSPATGSNFMTIEALFGCAVADGAKCAIIPAS